MLRSSGHLRALAIALTLTWVLTPLVSAFHSDEHAHRYCLEHRTFEEGGTLVVDPGFSPDEAHVFALAADESEDEHVACALASPGSRSALCGPDRSGIIALRPTADRAVPQDTREHPPIERLDLAPKLSPPFAPAA